MDLARWSGMRLFAFSAGRLSVPATPGPVPPVALPSAPPSRDAWIRQISAWGGPAPVSPQAGPRPLPKALWSNRNTEQYRVYGATEAVWLGGAEAARNYLRWILKDAARRGEMPVVAQYAIPGRDRGGPSAGGASSLESYLAQVELNARVIGNAPALVVIEPDALAFGLDARAVRGAVETYRRLCPNARIYIDAGHSAWRSADDMAARLIEGGVALADGFALNVSAFQWTSHNLAYGDALHAALVKRDPALAAKQFVIDTSRNGNGPGVDDKGHPTWGDPVRAQNGGPIMNGPLPTTETGNPRCAAFIWVKGAGEGDNRTRPAGEFRGAEWVTPTRQPRLGP